MLRPILHDHSPGVLFHRYVIRYQVFINKSMSLATLYPMKIIYDNLTYIDM